jgi:hypothetical protein
MAVKTTVFTVEGSGQFPIDMLRRDRAYPVSEEDADKIEGFQSRRRQVELAITFDTRHLGGQPTVGRWKSWDWPVIEINGKGV